MCRIHQSLLPDHAEGQELHSILPQHCSVIVSFWEMGTEQQREGRLVSRDALSLFAEGENLVLSFRNPLPQALE